MLQLIVPTLLVHFDKTNPLMLLCDASLYSVGAILSHLMDDQSDKPTAYASCSLNTAEWKYLQLDKDKLYFLA